MTDEWRNRVEYEGWVLDCRHYPPKAPCSDDPLGQELLHRYKLRVGFGDIERIEVTAFRRGPSKRLKVGAAVRVTGKLIHIENPYIACAPRHLLKVHADRVEVIDR